MRDPFGLEEEKIRNISENGGHEKGKELVHCACTNSEDRIGNGSQSTLDKRVPANRSLADKLIPARGWKLGN